MVATKTAVPFLVIPSKGESHTCAPAAKPPFFFFLFFFSTRSKFPKLARQSLGDRAADVAPTMSSWALALHKRENSRETVARKGRRGGGGGPGSEHTRGFYTTQGTDLRGEEGSACRTRRSYNARSSCAPCFSTPLPASLSLSLSLSLFFYFTSG